MVRGWKGCFAVAAALTLVACSRPDYSRDGISDDQRNKDEALCRSQIEGPRAKERGIVADREATLGGTDQRLGRTQLPDQMAARDDRNRSAALMDSCMKARGYSTPNRYRITY